MITYQTEAFVEYRDTLATKLVIVNHRTESRAKVIPAKNASRYFIEGRKRIKAKLINRMAGFWSVPGILLTLTYDPKRITKDDAWQNIGRDSRAFMDRVNTYRKRHDMAKAKGIRVLEVQKGTGYPHIHYVFPKLRYLAPIAKLTAYWAQAPNSVDLKYRDAMSPTSYVCKYITKMEHWQDEHMAQIWANRTRLYSISREYYVNQDTATPAGPSWCFYRTADTDQATDYHYDQWLPSLLRIFDTVEGVNDYAKAYLQCRASPTIDDINSNQINPKEYYYV